MQRPSNRSYSLRGDRMTRAQSLAMDQHWSNYSISVESVLDFEQIFINKEKVIVEIGSGMGEATAQIAPYENGVRFAGYYKTIGTPLLVYDTLQESIDAQVTTPPSAIQRQGTDIRSNNPRLNIPGTPREII